MRLEEWTEQNCYSVRKRKELGDGRAYVFVAEDPSLAEAQGKLKLYQAKEAVIVVETKEGLLSQAYPPGFLRVVRWKAGNPKRRKIVLFAPTSSAASHYGRFVDLVINQGFGGYPKFDKPRPVEPSSS